MTPPRLLDLYSGAGGIAMGYARAGFDVLGVDIRPQRNYPFTFIRADALTALSTWDLSAFAAIHASPVCKRYSSATPMARRAEHPDDIAEVRRLLTASGRPWVIENVPGAPMRADIRLCGCVVGLAELERQRWFEIGGWTTFDLLPSCYHATSPITVAGHGEPSGPRRHHGTIARKADWVRAMGIDWMSRDELAQAVPPAYGEYVGARLLAALGACAA